MPQSDNDDCVREIFVALARAVANGKPIVRVSSTDKEFSFQNWFAEILDDLGLQYDEPSRNAYPDFRLIDYPLGFEIKGLGLPGRVANYDCNSQVPSGNHRGRHIYYVFGRYPARPSSDRYPVLDLVCCHGDFLNADHTYEHENKNFRGFGSYGDLMVRDRKMYVAPTPYALADGTEGQVTLIAGRGFLLGASLSERGDLERIETDQLIRGYCFDMVTHDLTPTFIDNPNAGKRHLFTALRLERLPGPIVVLR